MKIADMLFNLGDIFNLSKINNDKEFEELYEKDDQKAIESDWKGVGDAMRKIMYGDKDE